MKLAHGILLFRWGRAWSRLTFVPREKADGLFDSIKDSNGEVDRGFTYVHVSLESDKKQLDICKDGREAVQTFKYLLAHLCGFLDSLQKLMVRMMIDARLR